MTHRQPRQARRSPATAPLTGALLTRRHHVDLLRTSSAACRRG